MPRKYLFIGQSNVNTLFGGSSVAPLPGVSVSTNGSDWSLTTGSGAITFANELRGVNGFNDTIGVLNAGVGGTTLLAESSEAIFREGPIVSAAHGHAEHLLINYWLNEATRMTWVDGPTEYTRENACYTAPSPPTEMPTFIGMLAKCAGNTFDGVIWQQGEADAHGSPDGLYRLYYDGLTTLWNRIKRDVSLSAGAKFIVVTASGDATAPFINSDNWTIVRRAQRDWCHSTPDAIYAGQGHGYPTGDGLHWTESSAILIGRKIAQAVLHDAGRPAYTYALGPRIVGWSQSGVNIDVKIQHDGGTDFTPTQDITGFTAIDTAGNELTVFDAHRYDATTIRVVMNDETPVAYLRYLHGSHPDLTGMVKDNSPLTLPLEFYSEDVIVEPDADSINLSWGPYDVLDPVLTDPVLAGVITTYTIEREEVV